MAASLAGLLAFCYIAISGIRASAYVAVLKDILLIAAILLTGLVAMAHWSGDGAPATQAALKQVAQPSLESDVFAITTILLQSLGFLHRPTNLCVYFHRTLGVGGAAGAGHHAALYGDVPFFDRHRLFRGRSFAAYCACQ